MADKLEIYRGALRLLGPTARLSSLSEVGPARYALDDAWEPAIDYLLAKGLWNFAMRNVQAVASDTLSTEFGYQYVFEKPDDWVRTASISDHGFNTEGFEDFEDRTLFWVTSVDTLYIQYVSDHDDYGFNISAWRQPFAKTLEAYLAFECGLPISSDKGNRNDLYSLFKSRLKDAKSLDAVDERVRRMPPGRLVRSRLVSGNRKDG